MKRVNNETGTGGYASEETMERRELLEKLQAYRRSGCAIALGGKYCYPQAVVNAYFREDRTYMPDYISDEDNQIREINFIRIRKEKH